MSLIDARDELLFEMKHEDNSNITAVMKDKEGTVNVTRCTENYSQYCISFSRKEFEALQLWYNNVKEKV